MTTYRNGEPVHIPAKVIGAYMANRTRNMRASHYVGHRVLVGGQPTGHTLMLPVGLRDFTYKYGIPTPKPTRVEVLGRKAMIKEVGGKVRVIDFERPLPESWLIDLNGGELEDWPSEE